MSGLAVSSSQHAFLRTEDDLKDQLRKRFDQYNNAKLVVDGSICQNVTLRRRQLHGINPSFGYEYMAPIGMNNSEFTLSFITTNNTLYEVDFERFYFNKDETIFVRQPRNLSNELVGQAKVIDYFYDVAQRLDCFIVGTGIPLSQK